MEKIKRFFTSELKEIDCQRKREYRKHGKSTKFFGLKKKFDLLYNKASKSHLRSNVESLLTTKPGRAYSTLKSMGARPGEDLDGTNFTLPEFKGMDLTPDQIADKIANFFAQISQQY